MTNKEKLMQILDKPVFPDGKTPLEAVADYLLENDVVPVVRCRDCKQARELDRSNEEERIYIDECLWCMSGCKGVLPYEYCSDGERRDTND